MSINKSPRPLRWLVRAGLALAFLSFLLFAGSNLFLSSKLGQKFLQKNLNQRTHGITWQVAGATWSPWNGITVKELTAKLANHSEKKESIPPLLQLQKAELKPYWGQLIRGKKLFREIVLDEPQLNIPAEMLIVVEPTQPTPSPKPKIPKKRPPTTKPKTPQKPPETKQPKKPKAKPAAQKKPKAKTEPTAVDEKRFWIRLRNAKVHVYSMKLGKGVAIHSLNTDLPLGGPPTKGSLSWKKITLGKHLISEEKTLPIEWKSPTWALPNQDLQLSLPQLVDDSIASVPFTVRVGGSFSPKRSSRDFRFQVSLPSQPIPDYLVHRSSRFHLRSKSIAGTFSAQGSLSNPNSWHFDSSAALNDIEVYSELREQRFHFETARAELNLRNATLLSPNFSLRSERLSLLGNGQLHLGGYLLGVLRIIAEPELAERLTTVAIGSRISLGWTSRWLKPLETPDRYYRDLHFEGFLADAQVNPGRKGEFLPLPKVISLLKNFTDVESAEELPPVPSSPSNNP